MKVGVGCKDQPSQLFVCLDGVDAVMGRTFAASGAALMWRLTNVEALIFLAIVMVALATGY